MVVPTFRGGRLPLNPDKPKLVLAPRLAPPALAPPPPSADFLSEIDRWPMYGNDVAGDCVEATHAHAVEIETSYGAGKLVTLPDHVPMDRYIALTGFDPATGANDTGLNMQDALTDWRTNGLGGHRIEMFAFIDPQDTATVNAAIALFGWVAVGIDFPASAMDQFDRGETWTPVKGSPIEGGHAIPVGAYASNGSRTCVTWGKAQKMSAAFWKKFVEEVWVVVSTDWLSTLTGLSPSGLDLYGLGQDFAALTGEPNPIPAPHDPPHPPGPGAMTIDDTFAFALDDWLTSKPFFYKKKIQAAARTWLAAKGYGG